MRFLMVVFSLFVAVTVLEASVEIKTFDSPEQELRYKKVISELRCLVCQNQNLAGSDAGLAKDLRKQVYKMIRTGKSNKDITEYMVTRYGDFVLYRPPFKATTYLLWIGPFIILGFGLFTLIRFIRIRKKNVITKLTDKDKEKLKKLLESKG